MRIDYVAYGLHLRSGFALAGMQRSEARGELPQLVLDRVAPAELPAVANDGCRGRLWEGSIGEGMSLSISRGPEGGILFDWAERGRGQRARFWLDPSLARLRCAPSAGPGVGAGVGGDDAPEWERVLLAKVLANVSMLLGREALHAAAVRSPRGAVAILGPSGAGKSTLAFELARRGWPLVADDVLALSADGADVTAHPATPHMTLAEDAMAAALGDQSPGTRPSSARERWLTVRRASAAPCRVRTLCLLRRGRDAHCRARALPANPLLLAPFMLGFRGDAARQRRRFELYGNLVTGADMVRIGGDRAARPADLADVVMEVAS